MNSAGIIVLGSINMDLVMRVARIPRPGETVLGGTFFTTLGGKGANQAVAAARAGGNVTFLGAVGADAHGQSARTTLAAEPRLCLDYLMTSAEQPTGVAMITVDAGGENMITVASGANSLLDEKDVDRLPADIWRKSRVFLASSEVPLSTVVDGLRRAKAHGLLTIFNPAPATAAAGSRDVLQWVDVLTPNELEAAMLAGREKSDTVDSATDARTLRARGVPTVVVTRGAEGCTLVTDQIVAIPARRVTAVDSTGAGDAFNGALAAALAVGLDLQSAVRFGMTGAAISVTRRGAIASLPQRGEIEDRLADDPPTTSSAHR